MAPIPDPILQSPDLSMGAKVAYAQLARHEGEKGPCKVTALKLAAEIGVKERQVKNYLAELKRKGYIARRGIVTVFLWHPSFERATSCTPNVQDIAPQSGNILHPEENSEETPEERDANAGIDTSRFSAEAEKPSSENHRAIAVSDDCPIDPSQGARDGEKRNRLSALIWQWSGEIPTAKTLANIEAACLDDPLEILQVLREQHPVWGAKGGPKTHGWLVTMAGLVTNNREYVERVGAQAEHDYRMTTDQIAAIADHLEPGS